MTDQELFDASALRPWERRLHRFVRSRVGCAFWLVALVTPPVLFYLLLRMADLSGGFVAAVVAVAFIPSVCLFLSIDGLALHRRSRYWREIMRRYAGLSLKECVREAEAAALAADACVVLIGRVPLAGDAWLVRVWLHENDGRVEGGRVERRSLRPARIAANAEGEVEVSSGAAPLTAEQAEDLRSLANAAVALGTCSIPSQLADGSPAEVAVWTQRHGVVVTGRCDFAGVPADDEHLPIVRLMKRVRELGETVPSPPPVATGG